MKKMNTDIERFIKKCTEICIKCTYYFYNRRNKE